MSKSHDQRCIDSNRFGDGFDCNCEPDWKALCIAAQTEIQQLKAELRQYQPSDGMMYKLLGLDDVIREAARLLRLCRSVDAGLILATEMEPLTPSIEAWLAHPTVVRAVKSPLARAVVKPTEKA